ncbi:uncharacterized protein LOC116573599 [Mustela erminea]|uniref:uncharacterized protein LOC116573599 n=1 Tax=Mustela erminea TaxID=36723 RepID=UPI001386FB9A|nr:uncharacterized protein LOC116573599 [Mustela erminea]
MMNLCQYTSVPNHRITIPRVNSKVLKDLLPGKKGVKRKVEGYPCKFTAWLLFAPNDIPAKSCDVVSRLLLLCEHHGGIALGPEVLTYSVFQSANGGGDESPMLTCATPGNLSICGHPPSLFTDHGALTKFNILTLYLRPSSSEVIPGFEAAVDPKAGDSGHNAKFHFGELGSPEITEMVTFIERFVTEDMQGPHESQGGHLPPETCVLTRPGGEALACLFAGQREHFCRLKGFSD